MFSSSFAALVGFGFHSLLAATLVPSAAARFASIQWSRVTQCGNFTVQFRGGNAPAALPLSLTILPVNGTPIFIPLPSDAWNSTSQTGAAITFLPFREGTEFIASLDDANGRGTALVSDVLVIDKPETDSDSTFCLPTNPTSFVPRYTVNDPLKQCESFSIAHESSPDLDSPVIRAFVPKGPSFPINKTETAVSVPGVDTYVMDVPRDSMAVLLFQGQNGYAEASSILPVLGDINSDTACIPTNPLSNAAILDTKDDKSTKHAGPKVTIIVIAACVGVVGLVGMAMILWYFLHRRKILQARKFNKLDEAGSPSPRGPEKQMIDPRPFILQTQTQTQTSTSPTTSPISPADSNYGYAVTQQFVRNPPYIRMGSVLVTPTSPDPKDPFGEQAMGSILGPLSARASLTGLGATALGNAAGGSSTLALPRARQTPPPTDQYSPAVRSSGLRRSSTFDPASELISGTSPYWGGRLAVTPDNSLASNASSILRRPTSAAQQSLSSGSVSSVEIDRILEMATIYGSADIPDMPQPVHTAPATLRSSAYMAGRQSRRESAALSSPYSSPAHSRNNSATAGGPGPASGSLLSHSNSYSTLKMQRGFREPPLAPLPSSPLPSPGIRPSLDVDTAVAQSGLAVPRPMLTRSVSSSTRQSMYSDDGLDGFTMLQPPSRQQS